MKMTDFQTKLAIRGLYREGVRSLTIGELRRRIARDSFWVNQKKWAFDMCRVRPVMQQAGLRCPCHDAWDFSDRFKEAIKRLVKRKVIRMKGGEVCLRDLTNEEVFGKDKLTMAVLM